MKFGQFYLLETPPGKNHAEVYHEAFEQFRLMDKTGWDTIWLAEHHFDHRTPGANYYSITPSIHTMAAYAAAITEQIKIGTAVVVLPWVGCFLTWAGATRWRNSTTGASTRRRAATGSGRAWRSS